MKLLILTLMLLCSSCAMTKDCSVYETTNPKHCKCIRENGHEERARQCSVVANKEYRERVKKICYRRCFSAYDCSRCEEL